MKRIGCMLLVLVLLLSLFAPTVCAQGSETGDGGSLAVPIIIGFVLSLIVCLILKAGMKNVSIKEEAAAYIASALKLTARSDRFTHKTETRTKIERKSTAKSGR